MVLSDNIVIVSASETRPCILSDGTRALWHGFSSEYGNTIVELEDGTVKVLMHPDEIRFLDSASKFAEADWE